jgi:hypothetical protein
MTLNEHPSDLNLRFARAQARLLSATPMALLVMGDEQVHLLMGADAGPAAHARLPLGPAHLVRTCLRHTPTRSGDIEHAIDVIEDALQQVRVPVNGATLVTTDPALVQLIRRVVPAAPGGPLWATRDALEQAFQRMASVALGYPAGDQALGGTPHEAALLVLVRELMHHLGFVAITAIEDE